MYKPAVRQNIRLRLAILGPTGSGKSFTGFEIASGLLNPGERFAVIDTERESARIYADQFGFDVCELVDFSPRSYTQAISAAKAQRYPVLVIDSLSHAWAGKGGILEFVDAKAGANKIGAWKDATPMHNGLVDAILTYPGHIIVTMRTKMEVLIEKDNEGKTVVRKIGLQPVQRNDVEYEFTIVADLNQQHVMSISKTRCVAVDGAVYMLTSGESPTPGSRFAQVIKTWAEGGVAIPEKSNPVHSPGPAALAGLDNF